MAAAAQAGEHRSGDSVHRTFGHSMVVSPWGEILAEAPGEQSGQLLIAVKLSKDKIAAARRQIPMAQHRKVDRQTPVGIKSLS